MLPEQRQEIENARRDEMLEGLRQEVEKNADLLQNRDFPVLAESVKTLEKILPGLSKAPIDTVRNLNKALYWGFYEIRKVCDAIAEAEKRIPVTEEAGK